MEPLQIRENRARKNSESGISPGKTVHSVRPDRINATKVMSANVAETVSFFESLFPFALLTLCKQAMASKITNDIPAKIPNQYVIMRMLLCA